MSKNIPILLKGLGFSCGDGIIAGYLFVFIGIFGFILWSGFNFFFLIPTIDKFIHKHIGAFIAKIVFLLMVLIWIIGVIGIYNFLSAAYAGIDFSQLC